MITQTSHTYNEYKMSPTYRSGGHLVLVIELVSFWPADIFLFMASRLLRECHLQFVCIKKWFYVLLHCIGDGFYAEKRSDF